VFPVRRGRNTRYLRPEELATIMDAQFRRKLVLVEGIERFMPNKHAHAYFHFSVETPAGLYPSFDILEIDGPAGVMLLRLPSDMQQCTVPIDAVETVWRDRGVAGRYHVGIRGRLVRESNLELHYAP
jgi:hypothetical protein